ncbi:unnamed protein product [Acanthosepion pharaonis]|uniref:Uncharacterized protein n=1 Tax=Acanthosepion pharaonis TaxID=158019 RepID=A0A812EHX1_ACAPH|nr:unnamed protein product [Sepia pharaonis]
MSGRVSRPTNDVLFTSDEPLISYIWPRQSSNTCCSFCNDIFLPSPFHYLLLVFFPFYLCRYCSSLPAIFSFKFFLKISSHFFLLFMVFYFIFFYFYPLPFTPFFSFFSVSVFSIAHSFFPCHFSLSNFFFEFLHIFFLSLVVLYILASPFHFPFLAFSPFCLFRSILFHVLPIFFLEFFLRISSYFFFSH